MTLTPVNQTPDNAKENVSGIFRRVSKAVRTATGGSSNRDRVSH
jgi:hypothetical protein